MQISLAWSDTRNTSAVPESLFFGIRQSAHRINAQGIDHQFHLCLQGVQPGSGLFDPCVFFGLLPVKSVGQVGQDVLQSRYDFRGGIFKLRYLLSACDLRNFRDVKRFNTFAATAGRRICQIALYTDSAASR